MLHQTSCLLTLLFFSVAEREQQTTNIGECDFVGDLTHVQSARCITDSSVSTVNFK